MPIPRTERGKATAASLGLDRKGLLEQRRSHLALVRRLAELYRIAVLKNEPHTAQRLLQALRDLDGRTEIFSACVKVWISAHLP